ncbi:hypothetical protein ACCQ08_09915 [Comamonas sp. SY3]|uniref:hypothetical protein n=1 Tax=Comamonas sp. SY3 TaxID=3243601 RepID=UPI0035936356
MLGQARGGHARLGHLVAQALGGLGLILQAAFQRRSFGLGFLKLPGHAGSDVARRVMLQRHGLDLGLLAGQLGTQASGGFDAVAKIVDKPVLRLHGLEVAAQLFDLVRGGSATRHHALERAGHLVHSLQQYF